MDGQNVTVASHRPLPQTNYVHARALALLSTGPAGPTM
jgi:hypothetical protein